MGITLGNQVRLSGMVSGLDTDSIIKSLMKSQQVKYDKMFQTKTQAEWKRDAYNGINKLISDFKNDYASFLSGKNLLSTSAYKQYQIDMPQNGSLSVSASSLTRDGAYTVSIQQLASGATLTGGKASKYAEGFGAATINNAALKDIAGFRDGKTVSGDIAFSVNGQTFTFKETDTLRKVMDTVNASDAGVKMSYSQVTDSFVFETKTAGIYDPDMPEPEKPVFNFTYSGGLTLPDLMEDPGEEADDALKAEYAQYLSDVKAYQDDYQKEHIAALNAHSIAMTRYNTDLADYNENKARTLEVTDDSGFLTTLGINVNNADAYKASQEAKLTVNGHEITRNSNRFDIDGLNFSLTSKTTSDITFNIKRDVQKSVDMVKDFVTAYNTLVDKLYGTVTEKKNYSYSPLTDEQRADLKDSEAANWDAKAMSGILSRDPSLQTLLDDFSYSFSSVFSSTAFSSIGLGGSEYKVGVASKIELNEEKLRKALEEDPDKVFNMFAARVEKDTGKTDDYGNPIKILDINASGLIQRLTNAIDKFSKTTKEVSLKTLDNSIRDWESKMKAENSRLYTLQESYYKKYAQMEAALSKMQSQTSSITSLLSQ